MSVGTKLKPPRFEDLLRESLRGGIPAHDDMNPPAPRFHRRGNDAILDSDDCEIIVYELFGDRA